MFDHPEIKRLIHKIGLNKGQTDKDIERVLESAYKLGKEVIMGGDREKLVFQNYRIMGLGIFYAAPFRILRLKKRRNERNN